MKQRSSFAAGAKTSHASLLSSGRDEGAFCRLWPGNVLVVEGAGFEAAVKDADEAVAQLAGARRGGPRRGPR